MFRYAMQLETVSLISKPKSSQMSRDFTAGYTPHGNALRLVNRRAGRV